MNDKMIDRPINWIFSFIKGGSRDDSWTRITSA